MIRFVKAHACGNDFLILDVKLVDAKFVSRELAVMLCERNTGVGADGVEFLEWTGERSGRIRLFNADGSAAEISGNGTRCVAAWMAREKQVAAGESITLETDAGTRECRIVKVLGSRFQIASKMGVPAVSEHRVLLSSGQALEGAVVSMGNPHFVVFVESDGFEVAGLPWHEVGHEVCFHFDFPLQTNVEFALVKGPEEIEIRVFERGVGPTSSSGTGTCASAAAAIALRGLSSRVHVLAPGGGQMVEWGGGESEMTLTGPAELIAVGEVFE